MTQSNKALVEPASCAEGRNAALFKAASFGNYKMAIADAYHRGKSKQSEQQRNYSSHDSGLGSVPGSC